MQKLSDGMLLGIYLLLITLAELSVAYADARAGILFHIAILCLLFFHSGVISKDYLAYIKMQLLTIKDKKRPSDLLQTMIRKKSRLSSLLLALTLVPLIRILSLVMPLAPFPRIHWFIIIGAAVYLAFFIILHQQKISLKECGLRLPSKKHIPLEVGIVLLGVPFGYAEYFILQPASFIDSSSLESLIIAVLILFIATGLLEELIFRGLLQKTAADILGLSYGMLFVTFLFAILHSGNLSILDVLLVFVIGGLYALVVRTTKTIIGVSISHTLVNVFLFIVCPLTLG